jgi:hypothetical protein
MRTLLAAILVRQVAALLPKALIPNSSQIIVGDVRIQTLSHTLARVEVRGPRGFEDRDTFMAVNRSSFAGVPIIKTFQDQDGNTRILTEHYTVVLANQTRSMQQSPKKDTCSGNVHVGVDAAHGSKRIKNVNATQAECCAACNKAIDCIAWVLCGSDPEKKSPCYLMETFIYESGAKTRISGGEFAPPAPTPAPPPDHTISIIAKDNVTVLMRPTAFRSVPSKLSFPMPADFNEHKLLSWAIRDSPRFVPSVDGVVPPAAVGEKIDPLLANTSGFDLRNAATDCYVFLPGAAAAANLTTTASSYGYTGLRAEYLALTGPIPTLPDKAFGTWFSWYHPYNQTDALADITHWKRDDLPLDIWGLDMNWRITKGGMEGKEYAVNTALFPNMTAFMESAHKSNLAVYMNDHPMQNATTQTSNCSGRRASPHSEPSCQLSPWEVNFRWKGVTSLFGIGLDFW